MSGAALNPRRVAFLANIVERHCRAFGIRSDEGRDSVAASVMAHYVRGVEDEHTLLAILASEDDPNGMRLAI